MRNRPAKSNDINILAMDAGEVRKMVFTTDSKLLLKKKITHENSAQRSHVRHAQGINSDSLRTNFPRKICKKNITAALSQISVRKLKTLIKICKRKQN